jgi:hypothetical protein
VSAGNQYSVTSQGFQPIPGAQDATVWTATFGDTQGLKAGNTYTYQKWRAFSAFLHEHQPGRRGMRAWAANFRESLPIREALPMTISPRLPNIASMRSISFAAVAAATAIGTLLVAGCGPASRQASLSAATTPVPATARTGPATATPRAVAVASTPQLPISVESDSQMKAEGNDGPSSSILRPTSCQLSGATVTADGRYRNGGFVPNVYDRYGDVIVLYVFAASSPGYPEGMQLGASDVGESPVLGTRAPWHVSLSISSSAGVPARCVVAAQPTHDGQFAP